MLAVFGISLNSDSLYLRSIVSSYLCPFHSLTWKYTIRLWYRAAAEVGSKFVLLSAFEDIFIFAIIPCNASCRGHPWPIACTDIAVLPLQLLLYPLEGVLVSLQNICAILWNFIFFDTIFSAAAFPPFSLLGPFLSHITPANCSHLSQSSFTLPSMSLSDPLDSHCMLLSVATDAAEDPYDIAWYSDLATTLLRSAYARHRSTCAKV